MRAGRAVMAAPRRHDARDGSRTRAATAPLAAPIVAIAVIWFYSQFEQVPDKVWLPPSGEARLRPFLAAERFAERMGMRAKELRSMP